LVEKGRKNLRIEESSGLGNCIYNWKTVHITVYLDNTKSTKLRRKTTFRYQKCLDFRHFALSGYMYPTESLIWKKVNKNLRHSYFATI